MAQNPYCEITQELLDLASPVSYTHLDVYKRQCERPAIRAHCLPLYVSLDVGRASLIRFGEEKRTCGQRAPIVPHCDGGYISGIHSPP